MFLAACLGRMSAFKFSLTHSFTHASIDSFSRYLFVGSTLYGAVVEGRGLFIFLVVKFGLCIFGKNTIQSGA